MELDPHFEIEEVWSPTTLRKWRLKVDPVGPGRSDIAMDCVAWDAVSEHAQHDVRGVAASYSMDMPQRSSPPPPWLIGFSRQFKKDTHDLDGKLQGRIFRVLEDLSDYTPPFHPQGDTFKPLKGKFDGCWRYRIGNSRLVVKPEVARAQLNAIAFGARGSIYD